MKVKELIAALSDPRIQEREVSLEYVVEGDDQNTGEPIKDVVLPMSDLMADVLADDPEIPVVLLAESGVLYFEIVPDAEVRMN